MARSIVVEVRKAVVAGISDLIDDESVSVSYGWQGASDDARREQIYTNRPRATHDPAVIKPGRTFRKEQMDFDIVLLVMDPSKRPEEVDDRVMELGQLVEEFIADNNDGSAFGIPALKWLTITAFEMENRAMDTGSASLAQYTVHYEARLT